MSSSNKWKVSNTTPIVSIFSFSACTLLLLFSRKKVNKVSTKKEVYQFEVSCVLYLTLTQNKAFKEQIYKCLSQICYEKATSTTSKRLKHDSTRAINLIMLDGIQG